MNYWIVLYNLYSYYKLNMVYKQKKSNSEKQVKVVKVEETNNDDEPSWYHYLIVLLVLSGFIYGIYFIINYNLSNSDDIFNNNNLRIINDSKIYPYKHIINNVTYNLQYNYPINILNSSNISLEINKYNLLNSRKIIFSFYDYNGTDNKQVTIASVKLMKLLKYLFKFNFDEVDFQKINKFNCSNSNNDTKIIIFNPYSNQTGVFYNNNGCIEINSKTPKELVYVNDVFMFNLITS